MGMSDLNSFEFISFTIKEDLTLITIENVSEHLLCNI